MREFLYEQARLPAGRLRDAFAGRVWPDWMEAASDDTLVPMTETADNIRVLVAGGAGKHSCVIPSWGMTRSVTVPIDTRRRAPVGPGGRRERPARLPRRARARAPGPAGAAPGPTSPGRASPCSTTASRTRRLLMTMIAQRIAERTAAELTLVVAKGTAATPAEPEILQQLDAADLVLTGSAD